MENQDIFRYKNEYPLRNWERVYEHLPNLKDKNILDLGCAVGDQAYDFEHLGAYVIGIDHNQDLISVASKQAPGSKFIRSEIEHIHPGLFGSIDAIWCSHTIGYLKDPKTLLNTWYDFLNPDGFFILIETTNLLNHDPVYSIYQEEIQNFYQKMEENEIYYFENGLHMDSILNETSFKVVKTIELDDQEFTSDGGLCDKATQAWKNRLNRAEAYQELFGPKFSSFKNDFLAMIRSSDHKSNCQVKFYLCQK